ncbi:MAG: GTPase [Chloroflexota bacterium]|jgi:GTP-binding protein|nr:GTPase [Chloroflexota bacterium]
MGARKATRRSTTRRDQEIPVEGLPIVAVVGRPNVGKSTLFNRVVGERHAIVEDRARTTRDRLYSAAEWNGRRFVVVDTGGLERRPGDPIEEKVQEQARTAITEADVIVFVVDAATGQTPADQEAAEILRMATAPVLVAVNKTDNEKRELEAAEFHQLGWEETYAVSALHGRGVADLLDAVVWALPPESESELERKRLEAEAEEDAELVAEGFPSLLDAREADFARLEATEDEASEDGADGPAPPKFSGPPLGPSRVAIVGRPNVGKSSLLNKLLGEERTIVSDIPGTTRDAIDTAFQWNGIPVRLVDTAGIRRRGKVASGPAADRFSALRAIRAVGRADVAILVLDAIDELTAQDAHVAGYVLEEGTGLVIAINKWDLVEKDGRTFDEYAARLRQEAPFLDFAPIVAISAKSGQRVGRALDEALEIAATRRMRVSTGELNRVLAEASFRQPAPPVRGRRPKFYYATQAAIEPPTFVLFASDAGNVHFSYKRYLENRLRDAFGFGGAPLRLIFRERSRVELETRRARKGAAKQSVGARKPRKVAKPASRTRAKR